MKKITGNNKMYYFKSIIYLQLFFVLLVSSCSNTNKSENTYSIIKQKQDYSSIINKYLDSKKNQPTIVFNNNHDVNSKNSVVLNENVISWADKDKGLEIIINGTKINTANKTTLNYIYGKRVDNVNFANNVEQIKFYNHHSLVCFLLSYYPCTGLACSVNYQLIYDLKTNKESYFGRYKTGYDLELYHFSNNSEPFYISKTFYGGNNPYAIDTTEYVLYNLTKTGDFRIYKDELKERYNFIHIYPDIYNDSVNEVFYENWIEKIIK